MIAAGTELLVVRERPLTAGDPVIPTTVAELPAGPRRTGSQPRAARPARVVVVGAGMAGLVAASELLAAGHDPIVARGAATRRRAGAHAARAVRARAVGRGRRDAHPALAPAHDGARSTATGCATEPFTMDNPEAYCFFGGRRVRHHELAGRSRGARLRDRAARAVRRPRSCGAPSSSRSRARLATSRATAWDGDRGRVRPVLRARVPRAAQVVGGRDRDVRPPVQPGGADELVVPRAAARGARRLLHRPRLPRRRHRHAPARVPARARAAHPLRREDGRDRAVATTASPSTAATRPDGSRSTATTRSSPCRSRCCATSRCSQPFSRAQAARHPPAPLRRVGEGVPAVPAALLGGRRRHRRRRHASPTSRCATCTTPTTGATRAAA